MHMNLWETQRFGRSSRRCARPERRRLLVISLGRRQTSGPFVGDDDGVVGEAHRRGPSCHTSPVEGEKPHPDPSRFGVRRWPEAPGDHLADPKPSSQACAEDVPSAVAPARRHA